MNGYKDHVKSDAGSKLITDYIVTLAAVNDSKSMPNTINKSDKAGYSDSVYWEKSQLKNYPITLRITSTKEEYRSIR